jgi:hypothetical protein
MSEQKLIEQLLVRAAEDAREFRRKYPDDEPNERWLDNSYTAVLPLAQDESGYNAGPGPHPELFDVYRGEVLRLLGSGGAPREATERDRVDGGELAQGPTRGEG